MNIDSAKESIRGLQSQIYIVASEIGDLIQQEKLIQAGLKKNDLFEIADKLGEIQNQMISCPTVIAPETPDVHSPLNFRFEGHGGESVNYNLDTVYAVTTLTGTGAGSLFAAPSNAYVIFPNLSGGIAPSLAQEMYQVNPWIMGQTSPAGIYLRGGQAANHEGLIDVRGNNHIWQHVRLRPDAPFSTANCCHGPFMFFEVEGGVFDHMSSYWGDDDCLDVFTSSDITVSNSIIAQGLNTPAKSARGSIISRSERITITKNLFAHHNLRGPQVQDTDVADVYNNVSYNIGRDHEYQSINGSASNQNVECNIEIKGPDSGSFWQDFGANNSGGNLQIYRAGNKILINAQTDCASAPSPFWFDTNSGSTISEADASWFTATPFNCPRGQKLDVCDVLDHVLANAGASHNRDSGDANIVADVLGGTSSIVSAPGPWPAMTGGNSKNPWDASKPDYLSDAIKEECGLTASSHQNTTQTNTNGGNVNDFVYIMNHCFGL